MLPDYDDIKSRLGDPLWYDMSGVPRYDKFMPEMCGIYDQYVALVDIQCQSCRKHFTVSVQIDMMDKVTRLSGNVAFPVAGDEGSFHYGDPPQHGCVGDSMNTIECKILEFWEKNTDIHHWGWDRKPEYEIEINPPEPV